MEEEKNEYMQGRQTIQISTDYTFQFIFFNDR